MSDWQVQVDRLVKIDKLAGSSRWAVRFKWIGWAGWQFYVDMLAASSARVHYLALEVLVEFSSVMLKPPRM